MEFYFADNFHYNIIHDAVFKLFVVYFLFRAKYTIFWLLGNTTISSTMLSWVIYCLRNKKTIIYILCFMYFINIINAHGCDICSCHVSCPVETIIEEWLTNTGDFVMYSSSHHHSLFDYICVNAYFVYQYILTKYAHDNKMYKRMYNKLFKFSNKRLFKVIMSRNITAHVGLKYYSKMRMGNRPIFLAALERIIEQNLRTIIDFKLYVYKKFSSIIELAKVKGNNYPKLLFDLSSLDEYSFNDLCLLYYYIINHCTNELNSNRLLKQLKSNKDYNEYQESSKQTEIKKQINIFSSQEIYFYDDSKYSLYNSSNKYKGVVSQSPHAYGKHKVEKTTKTQKVMPMYVIKELYQLFVKNYYKHIFTIGGKNYINCYETNLNKLSFKTYVNNLMITMNNIYKKNVCKNNVDIIGLLTSDYLNITTIDDFNNDSQKEKIINEIVDYLNLNYFDKYISIKMGAFAKFYSNLDDRKKQIYNYFSMKHQKEKKQKTGDS